MTHSIATEEIEKLAAENSDREIYCGPFSDPPGSYYADKIFTTKDGRIGFNVGGRVVVQPLRDWFELACAAQRRPGKDGENGCLLTAASALEFLSLYPRPAGGQSNYNAEHLLQIARELRFTATVDDAAEVERLRKEVAELTAQRDALNGDVHRFGQQIEELTFALERVVDHDPKMPGLRIDSYEQLMDSAISVARAALSAPAAQEKSV